MAMTMADLPLAGRWETGEAPCLAGGQEEANEVEAWEYIPRREASRSATTGYGATFLSDDEKVLEKRKITGKTLIYINSQCSRYFLNVRGLRALAIVLAKKAITPIVGRGVGSENGFGEQKRPFGEWTPCFDAFENILVDSGGESMKLSRAHLGKGR